MCSCLSIHDFHQSSQQVIAPPQRNNAPIRAGLIAVIVAQVYLMAGRVGKNNVWAAKFTIHETT